MAVDAFGFEPKNNKMVRYLEVDEVGGLASEALLPTFAVVETDLAILEMVQALVDTIAETLDVDHLAG